MLAFGWVKIGFKSYRYKMSPTDRQATRLLFYMFRSEVFCQFLCLWSQTSVHPSLVQLLGGKIPPSFEIWRVALFLASTTQIGQQDYCKLTTFQVLSKKSVKNFFSDRLIYGTFGSCNLYKFGASMWQCRCLLDSTKRGKYCSLKALTHYTNPDCWQLAMKGWFDFSKGSKNSRNIRIF